MSLSTNTLPAPVTPLFFPVKDRALLKAAGLPCKVKLYDLWHAGKVELVQDAGGRTGLTAAEAHRLMSAEVVPLSEVKRDTSAGVAGRQLKRQLGRVDAA